MEHIFQKIYEQQADFSKSLQKISSHFLNDPKIFAVFSATEAGREVGVSETTVIRFCKKLGYNGYSAMQEDVQRNLFSNSSLTEYLEGKSVDENIDNPIKNLMVNDIGNIQKTMKQISEESLETAVSKIAEADRVLVSGVRSSHALASWFAFSLDLAVGNTRLYHSNVDDVLLRISELTDESVFIAFSFHRYAVETIQIAKLAKQQGAFVIAITDSPVSPITEFSSLILPIQLNVKSTLDGAPAVLSLTNSIVSSISLKNQEKFQKRAALFDSIEAKDLFAN
ncbi:hypothetical protein CIL05_10135 [Virgibacillus profundi]|uniref:Transcriptional regulator n=1 Tax=Virgibacillus profundi TaxID=2024555 RepID=A0A2A2IEZ3_9BACI|nr:MurR/RpiR family transcriptional regulator [Virgibacillus profundi]PAV29720.1 hypothetical protein CIL05_10135 [Virgibacillus profundi]PXY53891.1 MurR/RpiR family transcriptional regulator [Virgibacillus profundi]